MLAVQPMAGSEEPLSLNHCRRVNPDRGSGSPATKPSPAMAMKARRDCDLVNEKARTFNEYRYADNTSAGYRDIGENAARPGDVDAAACGLGVR